MDSSNKKCVFSIYLLLSYSREGTESKNVQSVETDILVLKLLPFKKKKWWELYEKMIEEGEVIVPIEVRRKKGPSWILAVHYQGRTKDIKTDKED